MQKKAMILDLDGTLYFQSGVQIIMGLRLLLYYIFHFWSFNEFLAILHYRKIREQRVEGIVEKQFIIAAEKYNISVEKMALLIDEWLFKKPLCLLPLFKDYRLAKIIDNCKRQGRKIIIFSDYPTEDKLKALNINYDRSYDSTHSSIRVLKPDPRGLYFIMKENGLEKEEILFIGDRDSKDGACARNCKVDYVILPKFCRKKKYLQIEQILGWR